MPEEPQLKRAVTFVDGQNLYHCAREAFGCSHPNFDVLALSTAICNQHGWVLSQARFYTGYPEAHDDPLWNHFWQRKLLAMSRQGVWKFTRPLRYRDKTFALDDGTRITRTVGEEKGIDVRIALDVVRLALDNAYDVAVIFSQDQDLSEAALEVRQVSKGQGRWIMVASAYPTGAGNRRGINNTRWLEITEDTYNQCLDPTDYRPRTST